MGSMSYVRRSGCPKIRMTEGPDVRRSGCTKVRMSEDLFNRHYTLANCYILMTDNINIFQPLCRPPRPTRWEERLTYLSHLDQCDTFIEWSVDNAMKTFHFKLFTNSPRPSYRRDIFFLIKPTSIFSLMLLFIE